MTTKKDLSAELAAVANDTTAATPERQAHTPGPWTVDTIYGYDFALGVGTIDGVSALVTLTRDANGDRMLANAHLIAAAPEMLAVLKDTRHDYECHPSEGRCTEHCRRVRAAIKRAEGRS